MPRRKLPEFREFPEAAPRFAVDEYVARAVMSSREIASLTGKRHDNVLADVRQMLKELKKDPLNFQGIYLDIMNRQQTEHLLDEEHYTKRVVQKW